MMKSDNELRQEGRDEAAAIIAKPYVRLLDDVERLERENTELREEKAPMTHKQLCKRMALWVQNNRRYPVVATELATRVSETPDVLGFSGAASLLIECKVSRSDFLADRDKIFRSRAESGMGDLRYYAAPAGILRPDDMPEAWGLLEVKDRQVREVRGATPQRADKRNEVAFLSSILRRLQLSTAVFVRPDDQSEQEQA